MDTATRCHVIAGHDRQDRYLGQRPAAEGHIVRLTEACIGCRSVDSHGSVKRSTLNHRLRCRALVLSLQSLEACSQIAKKCWRKRETPQQDRLQIYTGREEPGTVRPERVTLILPPPARCQPLLCLSTSSIFLSPCLSFATATGRAKASILVSLPSVLKHGGYIYVDRDTSHPDWYSGLVTRYAKGYCI